MLLGITMGDSSGVGPELVLRAFRDGLLAYPFVVYGDRAVLERCNQALGYDVPIETIHSPAEHHRGPLCVIDHALLTADDVTPAASTPPAAPPRASTSSPPPAPPSPAPSTPWSPCP